MMNLQNNNLRLGFLGEQKAAEFLISQGYKLLEKNFKKRYGEIDLIVQQGNILVFVEVKTRISDEYGSPEEAITPWKLRSLIKSIEFYQMTHNAFDIPIRLDVVSVVVSSTHEVEKITHFKNITG